MPAQNATRKTFFPMRVDKLRWETKRRFVVEIFRVLAEEGFQRQARVEVLCSEPFAVIKRRLVFVP